MKFVYTPQFDRVVQFYESVRVQALISEKAESLRNLSRQKFSRRSATGFSYGAVDPLLLVCRGKKDTSDIAAIGS